MVHKDKSVPDFSDVRGGASSSAPKPAFGEAFPREPRTRVVVKGDSLSRIAKEVYGSAAKWPLIYEANRDTIQNPDLIHPGQVLRLPEEAS